MKKQGRGRRPPMMSPGQEGWRRDWQGEDDLLAMANILVDGSLPQQGDESLLARAQAAATEQHAIRASVSTTSDRLLLDRAMQKAMHRVVAQSVAPVPQTPPASRGRGLVVVFGVAFFVISTGVLQAATGKPAHWVRSIIGALHAPPPSGSTGAPGEKSSPREAPAAPLPHLEMLPQPADVPAPQEALPPTKAHTSSAAKPNDEPSRLLARAITARNAGNIRQGIALYETLQRRFPDSEEAAVSHVSLARLLMDRAAQPGRALTHYQVYLRRHGKGVLAEEALAGAALAAAKQGDSQLAAHYRDRLRTEFPGSIHLQHP